MYSAALACISFILPSYLTDVSQVFICIFNILWVTVFLEVWKRKCSELAYGWGTVDMPKWEEPRSNYQGVISVDPVTGRYQPKYPYWITFVRVSW